jgi:polysaccharide export outer membrane protein
LPSVFDAIGGLLLVLAVLLGAGCDRTQEPVVVPPPSVEERVPVGPGDVLEVRVREQDDLTGKYQVADDGTIRFPWIGIVKVAERDPAEVAAEIEQRLVDGWLRDPEVTVRLDSRDEQREKREVSVLGQVKEPGNYPYSEQLTLMEAITVAGGMNPLAQTRKVKLIRTTDKGRETFEINVNEIIDSRRADLPLAPGDIVFVPESPI